MAYSAGPRIDSTLLPDYVFPQSLQVNAGILIPITSRRRPHSSPSYHAAQFETPLKKERNLEWATTASIGQYFSAEKRQN
jgi:hypothetical protein